MLSDANRSQITIQKYNSEDQLQVSECPTHRRLLEAYCNVCHVYYFIPKRLICPTCLMFGAHKGHDVSPMEQSAKSLREHMDAAAKAGILKLEKTETVLVDIRHTKLTFDDSRRKVLQQVEDTFQQIFKLIKLRKDQVVSEINTHYQQQVANIEAQEQTWMDKQMRAYEVIKLAKQTNDYSILERAPFILESLEILRQNPTYKNVYIVNTIDPTFTAANIQLNLSEFQKALNNWIKLGEHVLIQFKC